MARTNGPIQVWHRADTIPTDAEGGYAGGDSTAAALAKAGAQALAAQQTIDLLQVTATTAPAGSSATATITGGAPYKIINLTIPAGEPGMGYAEGQALLADSQQAASDADAAVLLAQQAQAAALEVPDANVSALMGNPATDTRETLNAVVSQIEATAGDQTTRLNAWLSAPSAPGVKKLVGDFEISGHLVIPSDTVLDGSAATITQTSNLTAGIRTEGASNVVIHGLTMYGVTTDYVDASSVYAASAVYITGASSNVAVADCQLLGWAGAGVHVASAVAGPVVIRNTTMTGAPDEIAAERASQGPTAEVNYGAGVRGLTTYPLEISGCDISGFAQGVTSAKNATDLRITSNFIHNISSGQHGAYLSLVAGRLLFTDNVITDCYDCGMKVQIADPTLPESGDIIISDNVITGAGGQGVMVTNIAVTPPESLVPTRRFAIVGNVNSDVTRGIQVNDAENGIVSLNVISDLRAGGSGINVEDSTQITIVDNRITNVPYYGMRLTNVTQTRVERNTLTDVSTSNTASNNFGIHVIGVSDDLDIVGNVITDSLGTLLYGLWLNPTAPGLETFTVRDNRVHATRANSYGARFASASVVRDYRGNHFQGTSGRVVNPPTEGMGTPERHTFGSAAPSSGAWRQGDIRWNVSPGVGGWIGWVCITSGTPGQWRGFGAIDTP